MDGSFVYSFAKDLGMQTDKDPVLYPLSGAAGLKIAIILVCLKIWEGLHSRVCLYRVWIAKVSHVCHCLIIVPHARPQAFSTLVSLIACSMSYMLKG